MKRCSSCGEHKPLDAYQIRGGKRGVSPQANCKACDAEKTRLHRKRMRKLVGRWKMIKGCKNGCEVEHPCQLDLDHRDPSTKRTKKNGRAFDPSWSKIGIKEELSKCDVLCKNCHALKTFRNKDYLG